MFSLRALVRRNPARAKFVAENVEREYCAFHSISRNFMLLFINNIFLV